MQTFGAAPAGTVCLGLAQQQTPELAAETCSEPLKRLVSHVPVLSAWTLSSHFTTDGLVEW